jgi:ADP-ribosyl-[dinitrogen reductase] hydrolase
LKAAARTPRAARAGATPAEGDVPSSTPLPAPADDFAEAELAPLRGLRARFQGGLLGLATCDALAAGTQFRRAGSFTPVGDLLGGGPFDLPRGAWSDDTAMALCLAESLLEARGCDIADQRARYARWQREGHLSATGQCFGISADMARAIAHDDGDAQAAGAHGAEPLVRLLPVVLHAWGDRERLYAWATASARATGASPLAMDAARLLAGMLHAALAGASVARIVRHERRRFAAAPLCEPVAALAAADPHRRPEPTGIAAIDVLAAARWCLAGTKSFRAGALQAANLGGDSDQVGAVFGQLAGLHYGVGAIPRGWRESLARHDLLVDVADQLLRDSLLAIDAEDAP